jgi:hypothetical protein
VRPLRIYKSQGFLFAKYAVWVAAAPEATGVFALPHTFVGVKLSGAVQGSFLPT